MKAHPGTTADEEREPGGSSMHYSFDIKNGGGVKQEVGVDAQTGQFLENSAEGKKSD